MKQNMLMAYLLELVQRLKTKSPKFFAILQVIFGLMVAITGIPEVLCKLGIEVPGIFGHELDKFIAAVSTGVTFASMLTTQSTIVSGKAGEPPLKQTDADKLPFTAANEIKKTPEVLGP